MRCGFLGGSDESLVLGGYGEFPLVEIHGVASMSGNSAQQLG